MLASLGCGAVSHRPAYTECSDYKLTITWPMCALPSHQKTISPDHYESVKARVLAKQKELGEFMRLTILSESPP